MSTLAFERQILYLFVAGVIQSSIKSFWQYILHKMLDELRNGVYFLSAGWTTRRNDTPSALCHARRFINEGGKIVATYF